MGTNEKLLVLYPTKEGIIVKTLFYYDEIATIPKSVPRMKLDENELNMAKMLIENMTKPFVAEEYQDEYQARLREAIMKKKRRREQKEINGNGMMDLFDKREASPMLIAQQMDAFDNPGWLYELKLDGFRCLAYIDYGMVDLRNKRNIRMLPRSPELKEISKNVGGRCILDGEIVVLTNGVPDFYRLQKRTLLTDKFKIEMEASRLVNEDSRIAVSRYVEGSGTALYMAAEASKLEGVVAKRKDSFYLMGKRTKDWIKFKRMADEDFVVAGYIKKGGHMYSLILAKYKGNTLIFRGYVTSGVTKEAIDTLEVTGKNPFLLMPIGEHDVIWVKTNHVCVVEYMPNLINSLRQPVFKGFRDDVLPKEVQASEA